MNDHLARESDEVRKLGESGIFTMAPILRAVARDFLSRHASQVRTDGLKVTLAVTESEAGSNLFHISSKVENGHLSGRKVYSSGADVADRLFVIARKDDAFCVLWLDPKLKGITVRPMAVWGEADLVPCEVIFDEVPLPKEALLLEGKATASEALKSFNVERILIAQGLLGVARFCLKIACDEARTRTVFGEKPIGVYQGVQYPLAEVKMREAVLSEFLKVVTPDNAFYANTAKFVAVELGEMALDAAIVALGARAFHEERGLHHLLQAVHMFKAAPIGNNLVLNYVAQNTLELPKGY
jgi:acyl-CoA dehydrogenase